MFGYMEQSICFIIINGEMAYQMLWSIWRIGDTDHILFCTRINGMSDVWMRLEAWRHGVLDALFTSR